MCNEQEAALKIPTDECCGVPRTWGQSCFCRSSVHYFVWIVSLSEHYFKHDNMCPLNKTTFTFLLCLVVCINAVQDSEVVENEDKPVEKIRHSRYQKLDQLLKKIHKLDEIRPTEDKDIRTLINKFWTTDLANDTKNETDLVSKSIPREVEDYDDYTFEDLDEPEDSDYDVEIIGEGREEQLGVVHTIEGDSDPAVLSEMVKNYMADRWTTDIDSDFEHPSQDYDEQEWVRNQLYSLIFSV